MDSSGESYCEALSFRSSRHGNPAKPSPQLSCESGLTIQLQLARHSGKSIRLVDLAHMCRSVCRTRFPHTHCGSLANLARL